MGKRSKFIFARFLAKVADRGDGDEDVEDEEEEIDPQSRGGLWCGVAPALEVSHKGTPRLGRNSLSLSL